MNWKTYHYTRSEPGGPWFSCPTSSMPELKIERPIRPDIAARCAYVLRGRVVGGHFNGFTGLIPTQWENTFWGDLLLPAGKSFCVVKLKADSLELGIAEKIRVYPRSRAKVVAEYLTKKSPAK